MYQGVARMDMQGRRQYADKIIHHLSNYGSFEHGAAVIWVGDDGYWVRVGKGTPHGFGWERPAALQFFLCQEGNDESPEVDI